MTCSRSPRQLKQVHGHSEEENSEAGNLGKSSRGEPQLHRLGEKTPLALTSAGVLTICLTIFPLTTAKPFLPCSGAEAAGCTAAECYFDGGGGGGEKWGDDHAVLTPAQGFEQDSLQPFSLWVVLTLRQHPLLASRPTWGGGSHWVSDCPEGENRTVSQAAGGIYMKSPALFPSLGDGPSFMWAPQGAGAERVLGDFAAQQEAREGSWRGGREAVCGTTSGWGCLSSSLVSVGLDPLAPSAPAEDRTFLSLPEAEIVPESTCSTGLRGAL